MRNTLIADLTLAGRSIGPREWILVPAVIGGAAVVSVALALSPFLALGAVIGGVLTLFALTRPLALVGLMLVIGPADLSMVTGGFKSMFEQLGGLDMNGIRLIGMSGALGLVVLADRQVGRQLFNPRAFFYVALIAYGAATLLVSPAPLDGARLLLKIAYPLLVFLVITGLSPDRLRLDRLMDAVLIGAAVLCLVVNPLYLAFGDFERSVGGWVRLRGVGVHQNPFAFYLVAAILMSFVRFTTRGQARYLLLCAICSVWMMLTITRIAFLAALVALFAVGVVSAIVTRRSRVLIGALIAALLITMPFAPLVLERSLGFVPSAGELVALLSSPRALVLAMNWEGRDVFWALVFQAFMASPVQGLGLGASAFVLRLHLPGMSNPVVHNDYLRLLADTGIIGVSLFACALGAWAWGALRAAALPDRTTREYALPAVGCIAALAIIGLTDNAFDYYGPFTQYVGFLSGGAIAAAACFTKGQQEAVREVEQGTTGGSGAMVFAGRLSR